MGSSWSSASSSSIPSPLSSTTSPSSTTTTTISSTCNTDSKKDNVESASRKRQRIDDVDDVVDDDNERTVRRACNSQTGVDGLEIQEGDPPASSSSSSSSPPPPRKRRRLFTSFSSLLSSSSSLLQFPSTATSYVMNRMCSVLAKGFILAIEVAVQRGEFRESQRDDDEELIRYLFKILDYFQSTDDEILRRGWRALYACTRPNRITTTTNNNNNNNNREGENEDNNEGRPDVATATHQGVNTSSNTPAATTTTATTTSPSDNDTKNEVATVVSVMKRYPDSTKVQMLGCRALRTLTNRDDNWKALWEAGAIEVFLKSLSNHPENLVMQGLAVTFLAMLVREEGEPPRQQVLEQGGVELIFRAMERFESDPHLLHTGCYAIHQLGFTRPSKVLMVQHGGIPLLLRSVDQHLDKVWLVDLCLSALSKLSDEDSIQGLNIIPLVLKSMEHYPNERAIQGHCLVLFLRAIGHDVVSDQLVVSTIQAVLVAMRTFQECSSIQFFGCAALREILTRTRNRPGREAFHLISSSGGIECVLTALEQHGEIFGLRPMAILFLLNVWELRNQDQQACFSAFGGSDNVVTLVAGFGLFMDVDNIAELD